MKKYLLVSILAIIIIPSIAFASWWNPLSWKIFNNKKEIPVVETNSVNNPTEEIQKLKQQIEDLQKKQINYSSIKNIKSQKDNDTVTSSSTPIITSNPLPTTSIIDDTPQRKFRLRDGKLDTTEYNELNVSDYIKNHKASLNKPVKILNGTILSFNQNNKNYIQVIDTNDTSFSSSVEFLVKNDNDYTIITNELTKGDNVLIYGFGKDNTTFNTIGSSGSYDESTPVIEVDAIYKCAYNSHCRYPYDIGAKEVFVIKK